MDHRKLGLRVYATTADYPTAFRLAERLIESLGPLATVRECRIYPYAKFEDQFGLWLDLVSPDQAAAFDAVKAMAAPRWEEAAGPGDPDLVWDARIHGGPAVLAEATWMHLELWGEP